MKNKSWQYPFTTLDDKMFDKNKDGELDAFETMFRDAHLNEMNRKTAEYAKERQSETESIFSYTDDFETTSQKETPNTNTSVGVQLLVILFANVILIGGIVLAIAVNTSAIVRLLILSTAVVVALLIFKAVGLYS